MNTSRAPAAVTDAGDARHGQGPRGVGGHEVAGVGRAHRGAGLGAVVSDVVVGHVKAQVAGQDGPVELQVVPHEGVEPLGVELVRVVVGVLEPHQPSGEVEVEVGDGGDVDQGGDGNVERAAEGVGGVHVDLVLGDLHLVVVELPRLRLFHAGQIVDHQTAAEERVVGHVVGDHHGRVDAGRAGARPRGTPRQADTEPVLG